MRDVGALGDAVPSPFRIPKGNFGAPNGSHAKLRGQGPRAEAMRRDGCREHARGRNTRSATGVTPRL